jgi:hypothetical protein
MKKISSVVAAVLFSGSFVCAEPVTWVGPKEGGDWGNPANWSSGKIPAAGDSVVCDRAGTVSISGTAATAGDLTLSPKTSAGGLNLKNEPGTRLEIAGDLNQTEGCLSIRRFFVTAPEAVVHGNYNATKGTLLMLQKSRSVHTLAVGGNLTAASEFGFKFLLNKSSAFSAVLVKGAVNLGSAKLEFGSFDGAACASPRLLLIQSASSLPLTGTFSNAEFGVSRYELNGKTYVLTLGDYDGGGVNNDVYLEAGI